MMHRKLITLRLEIYCRICGRKLNPFGTNAVRSSTFNQEVCYVCLEKNAGQDNDHKSFHMIIPEVTELEHDVIMNGIVNSEFFADHINGIIWSDTLIEECKITTPAQLPGVLESLVKKELISYCGSGADSTIQLTAEGYTYYLTHKGE